MSDILDRATQALRDRINDDGDGAMSARLSSDVIVEGARARRTRRLQLQRAIAALAVLVVTSAAWAAATGRLNWLEKSTPPPSPLAPVIESRAPSRDPLPVPAPATIAEPTSAPPTREVVAPAIVIKRHQEVPAQPVAIAGTTLTDPAAPPTTTTTASPAPPTSESPDRAAYRRAHSLQFHGGALEETLAAWDDYLRIATSSSPSALTDEASYLRALTLYRLGRFEPAKAALRPIATHAGGPRSVDADNLLRLMTPSAPPPR